MNGIGLLKSNQFMQICKLCNLRTRSLIINKLCDCTDIEAEREQLWTLILESCGIEDFKRAFEKCVNILKLGSKKSQKHFCPLVFPFQFENCYINTAMMLPMIRNMSRYFMLFLF